MMFKATLLKDPSVSVNRVAWSPEGCLFGVAYSKHLVQIYSYNEAKDARQQLEIDAHVGGVNDLTFSAPEKQLLVITCGDDKIVKAWDATNGVKIKGNVHFVFATSVNGNIKVWLYDNLGARVDYDAPGLGCTSMAYSGDRRLFSCGTSKSGESFLVEWDDSEGAIKRSYLGLQKNPSSVVQFDIMKNQVLAAGDEHVIKIWNMNKTELFTTIDAEGGLLANPCVRFNKEGTLLAVSANDNKIKILAKDGSLQLLHTTENCLDDDLRVFSDALTKVVSEAMSKVVCAQVSDEDVAKNGNLENSGEVKSKITGKDTTSKSGRLIELHRPSQCQILRLPFAYESEQDIEAHLQQCR
ncbi:hypothetical protein OIU84_000186 [Salix udensis]|uniref:Uncharacterized protein n=1 Tax=Salix udensis TaxID=889485 RepID=A0AAD6PNL9_9ROSI|nr:hypothetical protein OIU84_000186 [Salix udensis]